MTDQEVLAMVVKATERKCHDDHSNHADFSARFDMDAETRPRCDCGTQITVHEVKVNDRYDPDWRKLQPGEFEANHYHYPEHTAPEVRCTHTIELQYCKRGYRALYGVNIYSELCELWAD